jgi:hypothetical protein
MPNVFVRNVVIPSAFVQNVDVLSVIRLNVVIPSTFVQNVAVLSAIRLNVVRLSVVALQITISPVLCCLATVNKEIKTETNDNSNFKLTLFHSFPGMMKNIATK